MNQEKYELTITADAVASTDKRFTMENLSLGDGYKPLEVYFKVSATGEVITRRYSKGEKKISNQTMPRLAFQIFEKQISELSFEEKESFPVCQYSEAHGMIRGIFSSVADFRKYRNSMEYTIYRYNNGRQFVTYCWNIFSPIYFVQECLKRFGNAGDQFVLIYREKDKKEEEEEKEITVREELEQRPRGYRNPYSSLLIESKNIIFRGAPGTGKTYLAKEIAADIISDGYYDDYNSLTAEQREQVEFVQFHPSYDYTDFVEGLRPRVNEDGSMAFELQDGVFKKFVARARKNYEDSLKSKEEIEKEISAQKMIQDYLDDLDLDPGSNSTSLKTINGHSFFITEYDEMNISVYIPDNKITDRLFVSKDNIQKMLESGRKFSKVKEVTEFFDKKFATQQFSYELSICHAIQAKKRRKSEASASRVELKKYIFIIDEINRGEMSKIFGELFFSIDPGYRGRKGEVSTQYSNLHDNPDEKFYIPENVYIIGTMNDIDRSVDSFDFAMRRRFRFIELRADDHLEMLSNLNDEELEAEAIRRMSALNEEIANTAELNENYQIGASYFLKLKTLSFDKLWTDYLQPLLQDYIQGMYDEKGIMNKFAKAYGYEKPDDGDVNEASQN